MQSVERVMIQSRFGMKVASREERTQGRNSDKEEALRERNVLK